MEISNLKLVSIVNFVRGGKSSVSRLLAETLGSTILNFDPKRDSEFYNAIKTINIPENATIERKKDVLELETDDEIIEISSSTNFFICDFGGRFDERIAEFESDLYILPTMDDYESISETIRATKYILRHNPKARIIHILNMAQSFGADEKEEFRDGYKSNIEAVELSFIPFIEMPRSKLVKKMINNKELETDIIGDNNFLKKGSYRQIKNFTDDLIELMKKEMKL